MTGLRRRARLAALAAAAVLLALPSPAAAQDSGIAGEVMDNTGGVLPGVTVEVASPALIEQSRVAFTDASGLYRFTALRPGTYTMTFSLPGFSTVVREGIVLTAQFTANIDAQLSVGALEETVTVTGESPLVDVQHVQQQQVLTKEVVDALPMNKNWASMAVLTVGVKARGQDVGGARTQYHPLVSAHGGSEHDGMRTMDGLAMGNFSCGYSCTTLQGDDAATEELTFEIGAASADAQGGGVRVNIIPKEGGNIFSGSGFINWANHSMQGDNLGQRLLDLGVTSPDRLERIWDASGALGGPIVRDKLWFHTTYRDTGLSLQRADAFFEFDPTDNVYDPNPARPAFENSYQKSVTLRLTSQATQNNKFSLYYNVAPRHYPYLYTSRIRPPDASSNQVNPINAHTTATWTSTVSNRLLLEAGMGAQFQDATTEPLDPCPGMTDSEEDFFWGCTRTTGLTRLIELSDGRWLRSWGQWRRWLETHRAYKASASYVTGSHAFKAGLQLSEGPWKRSHFFDTPTDSEGFLLDGVPVAATIYATPYTVNLNVDYDGGLYVQDVWTMDRLTLNLGVRLDITRQSVPAQDTSAYLDLGPGSAVGGSWAPRRTYPGIPEAANWKDLNPRIGVAYDLFGDGRTALKASLSRYLQTNTVHMSENLNPIISSINSTTVAWDDLNGDLVVDPDEIGAFDNENFGQSNVQTNWADDVRLGWFNRRHNWEFSAGFEHEVLPRVSAEISYWHRRQGGFTVRDNARTTAADYDPYCINVPTDPRLGAISGTVSCTGLAEVSEAAFGKKFSSIDTAANLGVGVSQVYDGIDIALTARPSGSLYMYGGVNFGRTRSDDCSARIDSPMESTGLFGKWGETGAGAAGAAYPVGRFCAVSEPFYQPHWKWTGTYTLPWYDISIAGSYQGVPGVEIRAIYPATSEEIAMSLGRPLSGGRATQNINLVQPYSMYGDRINQFDVRVGKYFDMGDGPRLHLFLDAYNLTNSSTSTEINTVYGADWQKPTLFMLARFIKIGANFTF